LTTIAIVELVKRLNRVDLPTLGRPTKAMTGFTNGYLSSAKTTGMPHGGFLLFMGKGPINHILTNVR